MMGEAKGLSELDTKYIASFSGGKDSMATVILAHENKEPLDLILFAEVMFDKKISGELPEHMDFIKNKAIPLFNEWGYTDIRPAEADLTLLQAYKRGHEGQSPSMSSFLSSKAGSQYIPHCALPFASYLSLSALPSGASQQIFVPSGTISSTNTTLHPQALLVAAKSMP